MPPRKKAETPTVPTVPEDTNTTVTLSSTYHEPANRPESFKALRHAELVEAALHFGTEDEGSDELIRADLEANNVTWNMYSRWKRLPGWEELPDDDFESPELPFPEPLDDWDEEEDKVKEVIVTAPAVPVLEGGSKFLVKFIGQNWYFERGKYSFSKDAPYALMSADDAQAALVEEPTKFRQAFPAELKEFYK